MTRNLKKLRDSSHRKETKEEKQKRLQHAKESREVSAPFDTEVQDQSAALIDAVRLTFILFHHLLSVTYSNA